MTRETIKHPLIPADRVNGTDVYSEAGDKIGKIEDIAIDKVSGNVAYAILSFGGFLGMGEKYYPLPWSVLQFDPGRDGYVAPVSEVDLKQAPAFSRAELSGWDDTGYREQVYSYYLPFGASPYWGRAAW